MVENETFKLADLGHLNVPFKYQIASNNSGIGQTCAENTERSLLPPKKVQVPHELMKDNNGKGLKCSEIAK